MTTTSLGSYFNLFQGAPTVAMKPMASHSSTSQPPASETNQGEGDSCVLSPKAREEAKVQADASKYGLHSPRDYVRDGSNKQLLDTLKAVVDSDPELKGSPLAKSVANGRVSADDIKQIQAYAQKKGYDVGSTGVDGKFGMRTSGALEQMLSDRGKGGAQAAATPQPTATPQAAPQNAPKTDTAPAKAPYVSPYSAGGRLMTATPQKDAVSQRLYGQRTKGADGQTYSSNTGYGPKVAADDATAAKRSKDYAELKRFAEENGTLDGTFVTPTTSLEQDAANMNRLVDAGLTARNQLLEKAYKAPPQEQAAMRQAEAELQAKRVQGERLGVYMTEAQYFKQQSLAMDKLYKDGGISPELGEQNRAFMEINRMADRAAVNMRLKFGTPALRDAGEKATNESPFNPARGTTAQQRLTNASAPGSGPRAIEYTSWRADSTDGSFAVITRAAAQRAGLPELPVWDD
ncbi:MAG: hypothetical protein EB084_13475 [Proteobacteria bacterium]|nr:hypothetical protein [Pseudomonadota bacterium]